MDIDEFKNAKKVMEQAIFIAARAAVDEFSEKTGHCPDSITICMMEVTSIGDNSRQFVINKVDCDVKI